MPSIRHSLIATAKLALAGASILAIGWMVGVLQPDGSVADSQADILDLSMIELSNSAKFARGLDQLGHDQPQTMSINGNVVHFSMNRSKKRPEQLMKEYQEEFVRQGINDKVWDRSNVRGNTDDMLVEAMAGAVVPIRVSDDYASMGGMVAGNDARDKAGLMEMAFDENTQPEEIFKGHKHIEMFWDRMRRESTVTATWSDENFNYAKMIGESQDDVDVDPTVPACPGCSRVSRVRDLDAARGYSNNIFKGSRNQADLMNFYRQAMRKRGWQETESSITFNTMRPYVQFHGDEASLLQFSRGNQFLTILGYPSDSGKTTIHTVVGN